MDYLSSIFLFIAGLIGGVLLPNYPLSKVVLWILFLLFIAGSIFFYYQNLVSQAQLQAQTPVFGGTITPGDGSIPSSVTLKIPSLQAGQTLILLGNDLAVISNTGNNGILTNGSSSFLSVGINPDGSMALSATLIDSENNKVAKIIDNEFQAFPDYAFLPKQPDPHSLVVRDSDGVVVLDVKFLNPQVIWLTGRFQVPGCSYPVVVSSTGGAQAPGGGISNYILILEKNGSNAFAFTCNP